MKRLALITAPVFVALNIYAQGDVVFDNYAGELVCNPLTGRQVSASDGIVVQLYASSSGNPSSFMPVPDSIVQVGLVGEGTFDRGVVRIPSSIIGPGAGAFLEVRAWETAYGMTFEEAESAPPMGGRLSLRGITTTFMVPSTGNPTASPPGMPVPIADLIPSFNPAIACPEPSLISLGLIGAGAFLVLRRCKQSG